MKMLVLNLNSPLFARIFITLFTTPQFVAKMIINGVLCKKIRRLAAVSSIHDGAPNRLARGMLKEKLTTKLWSL